MLSAIMSPTPSIAVRSVSFAFE
ncbi:uncharacterized protein METZ01_LOCUS272902, partial [marine metagenome]